MNVCIDISDEDVDEDVGLAPDGVGNTYLIRLSSVELTINYEQLASFYAQIRGWFEEEQ